MDLDSPNNPLRILESQLRENFGKIAYSHKTQEKCADILSRQNSWLKTSQIILSTLIASGLLLKVFQGQDWALITSTILSTIQVAFTSFLKEFNLGEIIQKHANAATDLLDVREKYLSLITDLKAGLVSPDEVVIRRDNLQNSLSKIYSGSPRTFSKAYREAQKALQINAELTFSDDEIDNFLPQALRTNNKS